VTLLRGGDGRGKSTLLRLLAGVQPAQQGRLEIHGVGLQDQPQAYQQQLCWIDARSEDFDQITATAYFALRRKHPAFDGIALAELVDGLGLAPHLDKPLYMLSTGSKRKVWLAAAFASGAAVTLLDDPFAALDKASIDFVLSCLQAAAKHPTCACLLAHHEAPAGVRLAGLVDLGD
jgi:ABC-type transport system involved in cytochrome c biogenesis ATPase subunit